MSELEFIRSLSARIPVRAPVRVGIGDDAAVLEASDAPLVLATDMLLDGVHFDLTETSPELAGRKALAVNLSDLAAMGCMPTSALVSLAIDRRASDPPHFGQRMLEGMMPLADAYRFTIAGGDTNSWPNPFAVSVTVTGIPISGQPVLRSGMQPGDLLFVTGSLGGSLIDGRHLTFEPQLKLAQKLMAVVRPTAMMDLSDGLAIDLLRMTEASTCGAVLHAVDIPIHPTVRSAESDSARQLQHALADGEDFELLFALSEADAVRLRNDRHLNSVCVQIGRAESAAGVRLKCRNGTTERLSPGGWQHL